MSKKNDRTFYKLIRKEKENDKKSIPETIPKSLIEVKERLILTFNNSSDFVLHEITIGQDKDIDVLITFIDGLVNKKLLNSDVIRPLMVETNHIFDKEQLTKSVSILLSKSIINTSKVSEVDDYEQSVDSILSGDTLIFIEGDSSAMKVSLRGWEQRGIEEPPSEAVVRGPREGFTETLRTNTALIRRKIRNNQLVFDMMKAGEQTNTDICICYIVGIANDEIIKNVRERLSKIDTDAILESGYIEEYIQDAPFSLFPTVGNSEKPDVVAAKVLEGRVAILCDGTPFVLTVPYLFIESLQSAEDYYSRSIYSIIIRFLRVFSFFITSMLPAYYVALVSFHQDIIPFKLLLTMSASREGIPFSPFTESIIMVITFEIIREAGVRMPRPIGQAVSIVGALVIGDAAVNAGLVSTPMVIVIALTAITSFIVAPLSGAVLIIRLITMSVANILGILGIVLTSIVFFIHLCGLKSFGVPYLSPVTPINTMDLKDTLVRFPIWAMYTRPKSLTWKYSGKAKYRTGSKGRDKK